MSIKPPSDLLVDVARAADPATSAAAAERLAKIAADGGKSDPAFSEVLSEVGAPPPSPVNSAAQVAVAAVPQRFSSPPIDADKKAYQGLEALLLQNVVKTMLPESSDIFGEGTAGAIWRSMLAEELGTDLAKKIDLGIAPKYLRVGHHAVKHASGGGVEPAVNESSHVVLKHT
ncbi:MAG: rod-binding protein [Methylovirgula sp.]